MATQEQMIGSRLLDELKFEFVPAQDADGNLICGGPQTFKATPETVVYIQALVDEGMWLILQDDGHIQFEHILDGDPLHRPR